MGESSITKWIAGAAATIFTTVTAAILITLIAERKEAMRERVKIDMRIKQLENIPFPTQFPPPETAAELLILKESIAGIKSDIADIKRILYTRFPPAHKGSEWYP